MAKCLQGGNAKAKRNFVADDSCFSRLEIYGKFEQDV